MTDASLRVPRLPLLSRDLGSPDFPLQQAARLDNDPAFTIAGDHARVTGGHARGVDEVWSSSGPLLSGLRVEGARAVSATSTPVGLERNLELGAAGVVERVVVPRADPVCFFEWVSSGDLSLPLTWRIRPPTAAAGDAPTDPGGSRGPLRWRVAERGLVVGFHGDRALYVFSQAPAELVVSPLAAPGQERGLEVRVLLAMSAGTAVRLAVAGIAAGDDEARILRVMDRSHVVVPTRRAEATRIMDERLAVEASDQALGDALAWSKLRLDARELPLAGGARLLSDRSVRLALASLATGDPAPARAMAAAPAPGDAAPAAAPADAALHLLVMARYLTWTGDLVTVKRARKAMRTRVETCLRAAAAGDDDDGFITGALRELVVVAEESGDVELGRSLRAAVGEPGRRVDMARRTAGGDPAAAGDPLLRAAALIEAVVHGLLGAEPDAPRGRLVLRPRLPGSWTRLRVRKLAVGGAEVAMAYDRSGGAHRFTLRQERGAAPLRVVLEPELEGRRVVMARVDGGPAELDPVDADGRLRVPVQLVLDHERRVELEIQGPDA